MRRVRRTTAALLTVMVAASLAATNPAVADPKGAEPREHPVPSHARNLAGDVVELPVVARAPRHTRTASPATSASKAGQQTTLTFTVSAAQVRLGDPVRATGRVSGGHRSLQIQFKTATGWMTRAVGTSASDGRFNLTVPTTWSGLHRVRINAPATQSHLAAASEVRDLGVALRYTPRGQSAAWRRLPGAARWNPCSTIEFKTNLNGAPAGSLDNVKRAFDMLRAVTGLRFRFSGHTTKVPHSDRRASQFESDTIIVAWTTPRAVPDLEGSVLGVGGSAYTTQRVNGRTVREYVYGGVALDSTDNDAMSPDFAPGISQGALLLHEIAHALGLNHVDNPSQVMNPYLHSGTEARFGAGDVAGLRKIGAASGCW